MICIKTEIPQEICDIDDELKAIYHSKDTICIWVFKTRIDRNKFMDETAGMLKNDREMYFESFYKVWWKHQTCEALEKHLRSIKKIMLNHRLISVQSLSENE